MTFRAVRRTVLLGALVSAVGAVVAGTQWCLSAFCSNVVAGVVGSATTIAFGLVVLEWYQAARWRPARDAALSTVGREIGLLIHRIYVGIDLSQYTSSGAWITNLEPADATVAEGLEHQAEAINAALRATPSGGRQSLLQPLLQSWFGTAELDRIRSLAFPLLAGTVDQKAVGALIAIERATHYAYYAREILAAVVRVEPAPNTDECEVVREMLRRLIEAYRAIVAAVNPPRGWVTLWR
jgi:hypothetical protein